MKSEHNIDKLFRENLYSRDISFDVSAWAQVEKMLDDRSKGRYPDFRIRYFLSVIIVALLTGVVWIGIGERETASSDIVMSENDVLTAGNTSDVLSTAEWNERENSSPRHENNQGILSSQSPDESATSPSQEAMPDKTTDASEGFVNLQDPLIPKGVNVETGVEESEMAVKEKKDGKPDYNGLAGKSELLQVKLGNSDDQKESEQAHRSGLTYMVPIFEMRSNVQDLEIAVADKKEAESPQINNDRKYLRGLRLVAGGGITEGAAEPGENTGSGFSYFAGILYQRNLLRSLAWEAGLVISGRNAFGMLYTRTDSTFDFGYVAKQESYKVRQLQMTEIPILLKYQLGTKQRVGLGLQYSYIFGARYVVETYSLNSIENAESSETAHYGIPEGLNQHDFSLIAQYEHQLAERFELLLRLQIGGMDLSSDNIYGDKSDLNHQFRIGLTFRLCD